MMLNNFNENTNVYNSNNHVDDTNHKEAATVLPQRPSAVQTVEPMRSTKPASTTAHLPPTTPHSWGPYSTHQLDGFLNGCYPTGNPHQPVYAGVDQYKSNSGKYHAAPPHAHPMQHEYHHYASQYPGGTIHHPIPVKCNEVCCQHLSEAPRYHPPPPTFQFSPHHIQTPRYSEYHHHHHHHHNPTNGISKQYLYNSKKNNKTTSSSGPVQSSNSSFSPVHSDLQNLQKYNNHHHYHPQGTSNRQKELKPPAKPVALDTTAYPVYPVMNSYWTPRGWVPPPPPYHQAVPLPQYKSKQETSSSIHCAPAFQTVDREITPAGNVTEERKGVIMNGSNNNNNSNSNNGNVVGGIQKTPNDYHEKSPSFRTDCFDLSTSFINPGFPPIVHNSTNKITINNITTAPLRQSSHSQSRNINLPCQLMGIDKQQIPVVQSELQVNVSETSNLAQLETPQTTHCINVLSSSSPNGGNFMINENTNCNPINYSITNNEMFSNVAAMPENVKTYQNQNDMRSEHLISNSNSRDNSHQRLPKKQPDLDVRQFLVTWNDTDEENNTRMPEPQNSNHISVTSSECSSGNNNVDDERLVSSTPDHNAIIKTSWNNGLIQSRHQSACKSNLGPIMNPADASPIAENQGVSNRIFSNKKLHSDDTYTSPVPKHVTAVDNHSDGHPSYIESYSDPKLTDGDKKPLLPGNSICRSSTNRIMHDTCVNKASHFPFYNGFSNYVRDKSETNIIDNTPFYSTFNETTPQHSCPAIRQHLTAWEHINNTINETNHSSVGIDHKVVTSHLQKDGYERKSNVSVVEPIIPVPSRNSLIYQKEMHLDDKRRNYTNLGTLGEEPVGNFYSDPTIGAIQQRSVIDNGCSFINLNNGNSNLNHNTSCNQINNIHNSIQQPFMHDRMYVGYKTGVICENNPNKCAVNTDTTKFHDGSVLRVHQNPTPKGDATDSISIHPGSNESNDSVHSKEPVFQNNFVSINDGENGHNSSYDIHEKSHAEDSPGVNFSCQSENSDIVKPIMNSDNSNQISSCRANNIDPSLQDSTSTSIASPLSVGNHCSNSNHSNFPDISKETAQEKIKNSDSYPPFLQRVPSSKDPLISTYTENKCDEKSDKEDDTITLHSANDIETHVTVNDCSTYVQQYSEMEESLANKSLKNCQAQVCSSSCKPQKSCIHQRRDNCSTDTSPAAINCNTAELPKDHSQKSVDNDDNNNSSIIKMKLSNRIIKKKFSAPGLKLKRLSNSKEWININNSTSVNSAAANCITEDVLRYNHCRSEPDLSSDRRHQMARVLSMPSLDDSPSPMGNNHTSEIGDEIEGLIAAEQSNSKQSFDCDSDVGKTLDKPYLSRGQMEDAKTLTVDSESNRKFKMCNINSRNQGDARLNDLSACQLTQTVSESQFNDKLGTEIVGLCSTNSSNDGKTTHSVNALHKKLNVSSIEPCYSNNKLEIIGGPIVSNPTDYSKTSDINCSSYDSIDNCNKNNLKFCNSPSMSYFKLNKTNSVESHHHDNDANSEEIDYDEERLISSVECTPGSPNVEELFEDINKPIDDFNKPSFDLDLKNSECEDSIDKFHSNPHCDLINNSCLKVNQDCKINNKESVIKSTLHTVENSLVGDDYRSSAFQCSVPCGVSTLPFSKCDSSSSIDQSCTTLFNDDVLLSRERISPCKFDENVEKTSGNKVDKGVFNTVPLLLPHNDESIADSDRLDSPSFIKPISENCGIPENNSVITECNKEVDNSFDIDSLCDLNNLTPSHKPEDKNKVFIDGRDEDTIDVRPNFRPDDLIAMDLSKEIERPNKQDSIIVADNRKVENCHDNLNDECWNKPNSYRTQKESASVHIETMYCDSERMATPVYKSNESSVDNKNYKSVVYERSAQEEINIKDSNVYSLNNKTEMPENDKIIDCESEDNQSAISLNNLDDKESHTITNSLDKKENHTISSNSLDEKENHIFSSNNLDVEESHKFYSNNLGEKESHVISSNSLDDEESRPISSNSLEESHTISSNSLDEKKGHMISSNSVNIKESHMISSKSLDKKESRTISSNSLDEKESHTISSNNLDEKESHMISSNSLHKKENHMISSNCMDEKESHMISSKSLDKKDSRTISSNSLDEKESHTISSNCLDEKENHTISSKSLDKKESHMISVNCMDEKESHMISSKSLDKKESHTISSNSLNKKENHTTSSVNYNFALNDHTATENYHEDSLKLETRISLNQDTSETQVKETLSSPVSHIVTSAQNVEVINKLENSENVNCNSSEVSDKNSNSEPLNTISVELTSNKPIKIDNCKFTHIYREEDNSCRSIIVNNLQTRETVIHDDSVKNNPTFENYSKQLAVSPADINSDGSKNVLTESPSTVSDENIKNIYPSKDNIESSDNCIATAEKELPSNVSRISNDVTKSIRNNKTLVSSSANNHISSSDFMGYALQDNCSLDLKIKETCKSNSESNLNSIVGGEKINCKSEEPGSDEDESAHNSTTISKKLLDGVRQDSNSDETDYSFVDEACCESVTVSSNKETKTDYHNDEHDMKNDNAVSAGETITTKSLVNINTEEQSTDETSFCNSLQLLDKTMNDRSDDCNRNDFTTCSENELYSHKNTAKTSNEELECTLDGRNVSKDCHTKIGSDMCLNVGQNNISNGEQLRNESTSCSRDEMVSLETTEVLEDIGSHKNEPVTTCIAKTELENEDRTLGQVALQEDLHTSKASLTLETICHDKDNVCNSLQEDPPEKLNINLNRTVKESECSSLQDDSQENPNTDVREDLKANKRECNSSQEDSPEKPNADVREVLKEPVNKSEGNLLQEDPPENPNTDVSEDLKEPVNKSKCNSFQEDLSEKPNTDVRKHLKEPVNKSECNSLQEDRQEKPNTDVREDLKQPLNKSECNLLQDDTLNSSNIDHVKEDFKEPFNKHELDSELQSSENLVCDNRKFGFQNSEVEADSPYAIPVNDRNFTVDNFDTDHIEKTNDKPDEDKHVNNTVDQSSYSTICSQVNEGLKENIKCPLPDEMPCSLEDNIKYPPPDEIPYSSIKNRKKEDLISLENSESLKTVINFSTDSNIKQTTETSDIPKTDDHVDFPSDNENCDEITDDSEMCINTKSISDDKVDENRSSVIDQIDYEEYVPCNIIELHPIIEDVNNDVNKLTSDGSSERNHDMGTDNDVSSQYDAVEFSTAEDETNRMTDSSGSSHCNNVTYIKTIECKSQQLGSNCNKLNNKSKQTRKFLFKQYASLINRRGTMNNSRKWFLGGIRNWSFKKNRKLNCKLNLQLSTISQESKFIKNNKKRKINFRKSNNGTKKCLFRSCDNKLSIPNEDVSEKIDIKSSALNFDQNGIIPDMKHCNMQSNASINDTLFPEEPLVDEKSTTSDLHETASNDLPTGNLSDNEIEPVHGDNTQCCPDLNEENVLPSDFHDKNIEIDKVNEVSLTRECSDRLETSVDVYSNLRDNELSCVSHVDSRKSCIQGMESPIVDDTSQEHVSMKQKQICAEVDSCLSPVNKAEMHELISNTEQIESNELLKRDENESRSLNSPKHNICDINMQFGDISVKQDKEEKEDIVRQQCSVDSSAKLYNEDDAYIPDSDSIPCSETSSTEIESCNLTVEEPDLVNEDAFIKDGVKYVTSPVHTDNYENIIETCHKLMPTGDRNDLDITNPICASQQLIPKHAETASPNIIDENNDIIEREPISVSGIIDYRHIIESNENMIGEEKRVDITYSNENKPPVINIDNSNSIVIIIEELCDSESKLEDPNASREKVDDLKLDVADVISEDKGIDENKTENNDDSKCENFDKLSAANLYEEKQFVTHVLDEFTVAEVEISTNCEESCKYSDDSDEEFLGYNSCNDDNYKEIGNNYNSESHDANSDNEIDNTSCVLSKRSPDHEKGYANVDEYNAVKDNEIEISKPVTVEEEMVLDKGDDKCTVKPVEDTSSNELVIKTDCDKIKKVKRIHKGAEDDRKFDVISISPSIKDKNAELWKSDNSSKPVIKCSLPWERVFNTAHSRKRKLKKSHHSSRQGIELGPAKIELRVGGGDGYDEISGTETSWKVVRNNSPLSGNGNVSISPVVKVKRLILQRDPELTSYSEDSACSSKEYLSSSSDEDGKNEKNDKQSCRSSSSLSSSSLTFDDSNSCVSSSHCNIKIRRSSSANSSCSVATSVSTIPKVLIKKMKQSEYKSFLKVPHALNKPVVKLIRCNLIDDLALNKKTSINLCNENINDDSAGDNVNGITGNLSPTITDVAEDATELSVVSDNYSSSFSESDKRTFCSVPSDNNSKLTNSNSFKSSDNILCESSSHKSISLASSHTSKPTFQNCDITSENNEDSVLESMLSNCDGTTVSSCSKRFETEVKLKNSSPSTFSRLKNSSETDFSDESEMKFVINDGNRVDQIVNRRVATKRQSDDLSSGDESSMKKRSPRDVSKYMFHCQRCLLVFNNKEEVMNHQAAVHPTHQELHHCMLCQRSFSSLTKHTLHIQSRSHRRMELLQRCTVHAMHRYFTGRDCPRLYPMTPAELKSFDWRPNQPGCIHFYHHPSPLQLALQENPWGMKSKQNSDQISTSSTSSSRTSSPTFMTNHSSGSASPPLNSPSYIVSHDMDNGHLT